MLDVAVADPGTGLGPAAGGRRACRSQLSTGRAHPTGLARGRRDRHSELRRGPARGGEAAPGLRHGTRVRYRGRHRGVPDVESPDRWGYRVRPPTRSTGDPEVPVPDVPFRAYRTRADDVLQVPTAPPYRRIWVLVDTPSTGEQIDRLRVRRRRDRCSAVSTLSDADRWCCSNENTDSVALGSVVDLRQNAGSACVLDLLAARSVRPSTSDLCVEVRSWLNRARPPE